MKFLKYLLATVAGLFIFFLLTGLIGSLIISVLSAEKEVEIAENSILHLNLNTTIVERDIDDPLADMGVFPGVKGNVGLQDLLDAIKYAAQDENIAGIYLEAGYPMAGFAALEAIRKELNEFRQSGKFLIGYADVYSEGGYYLSSVADEVYVHDDALIVELNGLSYNMIFIKDALDRLGIEPHIFKAGDYKSALEPLVRNDMSEANREQTISFLNSIYDHMLREIAGNRNISFDRLKVISDSMLVTSIDDAIAYNLVDDGIYYDEFLDLLRKKLELEDEDEKLPVVDLPKYLKSFTTSKATRNKIAVLVADGEIVMGEGDMNNVGGDKFSKEIRKLRKDETVKAIVLRVNSPGGGGLPGGQIYREVLLAAQEKPVIASFSNVAASAGYLISVPCDTIVAEPTSITGSIGVFGFSFSIKEMLNEKLGIHSDVVKTGEYSDFLSPLREITSREASIYQNLIDQSYEQFVTKVADGRGLTEEEVRGLAEGRVWTGIQAKEINLVDVLGGLDTAIEIAAAKSGIEDDYRVRYYPDQKNFFEQVISNLGQDMETRILKHQLGDQYRMYKVLNEIKDYKGIQMRLPFEINFE